MNAVAVVSILLGLAIIVLRGPLIFAPKETKEFYLKMLASPMRIRIFGAFAALIGIVMVSALAGAEGLLAEILVFVGLMFVVTAVGFMVPFPGKLKTLVEKIFSMANDTLARIVGVIAVLIGVYLIYAGAAA